MGQVEDDVREILNAPLERYREFTEEEPMKLDSVGTLVEVVLPLLDAQRQAIMRLVRELDER